MVATPMRVIINADDLGYSPLVNEAMFSLMEARRLTSATLMTTAPGFGEAGRGFGNFPWCSFGVHLTLTEFPPLTPSDQVVRAGMIDKNGAFFGDGRSIRPTSALKEAVFKEWCRQVERALDA